MAQFVLVNVVVAVLMKHLEESHKQVCVPSFLIHHQVKKLTFTFEKKTRFTIDPRIL